MGSPILPLDASGRQIGHFRDLKVSMILNASLQNVLVSSKISESVNCEILRLLNI